MGLDAVRAGEAGPAETEHVESCAECRGQVEKMRALAGRYRVEIPGEVDRRILATARPKVLRLRDWVGVGVAAALLVSILIFHLVPGAAAPMDVDRDGRVDIVDAYQLAARIRDSGALDERWDLNRDGAIDMDDVDRLGFEVVSIEGEGS
jgi:hypothetical protein